MPFWSRAEKTRLQSCQELHELVTILARMDDRVKVLKKASDSKGIGSIDYRKHYVFSSFVGAINKNVDEFNSVQKKTATPEEIFTLLHKICEPLIALFQHPTHFQTLATKRNNYREVLNSFLHGGALVGSVITATVLSSGFLLGAGGFVGAACISNFLRDQFGINDLTPESVKIIASLSQFLVEAGASLSDRLSESATDNISARLGDCMITEKISVVRATC